MQNKKDVFMKKGAIDPLTAALISVILIVAFSNSFTGFVITPTSNANDLQLPVLDFSSPMPGTLNASVGDIITLTACWSLSNSYGSLARGGYFNGTQWADLYVNASACQEVSFTSNSPNITLRQLSGDIWYQYTGRTARPSGCSLDYRVSGANTRCSSSASWIVNFSSLGTSVTTPNATTTTIFSRPGSTTTLQSTTTAGTTTSTTYSTTTTSKAITTTGATTATTKQKAPAVTTTTPPLTTNFLKIVRDVLAGFLNLFGRR